jgi:histidine triad (HIT) family protein
MTKCPICDLLARKEGFVYEDEKVVALIAPVPAVPGHVWVVPKVHAATLEQVPDPVMAELFVKVNKLTIALFESVKPEGTNVLIQNGTGAGQVLPHAVVHLLPRVQGDGVNVQWKPRQLSEDEMGSVELALKDAASLIGSFEREPEKPVEVEKPKELSGSEEDVLVRQLRRLP